MWQWLGNNAVTLATLVTTVATVALAILTWRYVVFTQRLVNETRAARQPTVFADLELSEHSLTFVVGNAGQTPAYDIRLQVTEVVPWFYTPSDDEDRIGTLPAVTDGIAHLAPGRVLKFSAGMIDWHKIEDPSFYVDVTIHYRDRSGQTFSDQSRVYLKQYRTRPVRVVRGFRPTGRARDP